jgi:metal-responsive CopG/Arc/MetJ family transcriptional regulator
MPPKGPTKQVLLRLEKDLFRKIEDFRFSNRFESRTEALRWLLEYALKQNPKPNK